MPGPPVLPITEAELLLCTATERDCSRWWCVSSSLVTCRKRLLRSLKNNVVSMATGIKRWLGDKLEYLVFLLCSAAAATAPASLVASARYDGKWRPELKFCLSFIMMPSGRFLL